MILKRFYEERLAQASYLVGCPGAGEAIVIDPNRNLDQYIDAARAEGLKITGVTETHIHADFVSGAHALAQATGARLYVSAEGGPDWQYEFASEPNVTLLRDGDSIHAGKVRLDALHTPGHTPEHLTFILTDEAAHSGPLGAFTGDFIFVGDVGRPDLLEKAAGITGTMRDSARDLFQSLQRMAGFPGHLLLWPAHGAGSACGKSLGGVPSSTLGYEALANWAFQIDEETDFVEAVLADQPEPPAYFARMKRVNKAGVDKWTAPRLEHLNPADLAGTLADHGVTVDLRPAPAYAAGSLAGSLSIPLIRNFTTWAGSIVPYDVPLYLIAESRADVVEAARALSLIGMDQIAGWFYAEAVVPNGVKTRAVTSREMPDDRTLIDVRGAVEFRKGHLPDAVNFPLGYLERLAAPLAKDASIVVYCQTGVRSIIAASILKRAGFTNVAYLAEGVSGPANLTSSEPKAEQASEPEPARETIGVGGL